ncbi:MAG: hypothetical protein LR015_01000 [Verrucomicrobia bacterium]|nr:hypothetical protein [Verrucomicrobiota bacterium]
MVYLKIQGVSLAQGMNATSCVTGRSVGFGDPIATHRHRNPHAFDGIGIDLREGVASAGNALSLIRGPASTASGTAVFYKGAALSATGKGAVIGIPMMMGGAITAGLGVTRSADDFLGDGQSDIPSGVFDLGAMMTGNESLRTYAPAADLIFSVSVPPWWAGAIDGSLMSIELMKSMEEAKTEPENCED